MLDWNVTVIVRLVLNSTHRQADGYYYSQGTYICVGASICVGDSIREIDSKRFSA